MSFYDDPMRPRPCFICLTEPAMTDHKVCSTHHDETACRVCNETHYRQWPAYPQRRTETGRRRNRTGSQ